MKITYKEYIFKCNICGKMSEQTISPNRPIGWMEFDFDIHYCDECADTIGESEAINLQKAVQGDKFLTRSGKEAHLVNIMQGHKRPYVFADSEHAWCTSWNGFVSSTIMPYDIVKKLK